MKEDPRMIALIQELKSWPGSPINSHKSASQFFHKLTFLADRGILATDPGMIEVIEKILGSLDAQGIPTIPVVISEAYGGDGSEKRAWALCDAPSTLYALIKMGVEDVRLRGAVEVLAGPCRDNGFGCTVSQSLGSWRGPGKASDPCPYATLIMVKLLLLFPDRYSGEITKGSECLLDLWDHSRTKHPYIFYMGTDFRKLKLPFIWYDILHVVEVLSQIPDARKDLRFLEMLQTIRAKKGPLGYTPESVYQPWKDWDFGQKKAPSEWMNACVQKIESRLV